MHLILLTTLVMIAFAANSVLGRVGLADGETGPLAFALVRVASGAAVLAFILRLRGGTVSRDWMARAKGAGSLLLYLIAFSLAYVTLPAGAGALILFGVVQLTMFAGALSAGEVIARQRWFGMILAFAGLSYLLWPTGQSAPDVGGAVLMAISGVGWGLYSLLGRGATDPLAVTGGNFIWAVPVAALVWGISNEPISTQGAIWAVMSGAVTSALGYALWYSVLPSIRPTAAAIAQLTVPLIAMAGGMLFLSEDLTLRFMIASVVVLGGIAVALSGSTVRVDRT